MNLNSLLLPNLILQLHWVKHSTILPNLILQLLGVKDSPLSFKENCEIELGKNREFFTQCTCEFKLSVFTQFNFTITLGKTLYDFIQTGL